MVVTCLDGSSLLRVSLEVLYHAEQTVPRQEDLSTFLSCGDTHRNVFARFASSGPSLARRRLLHTSLGDPILLATRIETDDCKLLDIPIPEVTLGLLPSAHGCIPTTASLDCPAHHACLKIQSLQLTNNTFAVVMCEAEEPCSETTHHEPDSPCTSSPRSTTRPLHVLETCPIQSS